MYPGEQVSTSRLGRPGACATARHAFHRNKKSDGLLMPLSRLRLAFLKTGLSNSPAILFPFSRPWAIRMSQSAAPMDAFFLVRHRTPRGDTGWCPWGGLREPRHGVTGQRWNWTVLNSPCVKAGLRFWAHWSFLQNKAPCFIVFSSRASEACCFLCS